jgi:hypothetical protein
MSPDGKPAMECECPTVLPTVSRLRSVCHRDGNRLDTAGGGTGLQIALVNDHISYLDCSSRSSLEMHTLPIAWIVSVSGLCREGSTALCKRYSTT